MIFLDFDGVIAPIKRWDRYEDVDPACVKVLNDIVAEGDADVVVSSTWRYGKTVAELQEILDAKGFAGRVLDVTPTLPAPTDRTDEITAWLAQHAVTSYIVIDDHVVGGDLSARLVLTQPGYGLRPTDTPRAIELLRRPLNGGPSC